MIVVHLGAAMEEFLLADFRKRAFILIVNWTDYQHFVLCEWTQKWVFQAPIAPLAVLAGLGVQHLLQDSEVPASSESVHSGFLWDVDRLCFSRKS